jgi:hypothetical protein
MIRGLLVAVLLVIVGALTILSNVSFWTQRAVLSEDGFVSHVGDVLDDPEVQDTIATILADRAEVFAQERLETGLTELDERNAGDEGALDQAIDLSVLAGPVASAFRDLVYDALLYVQQHELVRDARDLSVRSLFRQVSAIVNDDPDALLKSQDEKIILDLRPILEAALERVGITTDIEGVIVLADLPANTGEFEIGEEGDYSLFGRIINFVDGLHYPLLAATAVALVLAIAASRDRRRGVIAAALAVAAGTAILLVIIPSGRYLLTNSLIKPQNVDAATSAINIVLVQDLREQGAIVAAGALIVAAIATLFGGSSIARSIRSKLGLLEGQAPSLLQGIRDDAVVLRMIGAILTIMTLLVLQEPSGRTVAAVIALFAAYMTALLVVTSDADWAMGLRRYANITIHAEPSAPSSRPEGWVGRNAALLRIIGIGGAIIFLLFWSSTSVATVVVVAVLTMVYLLAIDLLTKRTVTSSS